VCLAGSSSQSTQPGTRKEPVRRTSAESQQVGEEFAEFLKGLNRNEVALDVSKQVRVIIERLQSMGEVPIDEYSEVVVSFYQAMTDRIHSKPLYSGEIVFHLLTITQTYAQRNDSCDNTVQYVLARSVVVWATWYGYNSDVCTT